MKDKGHLYKGIDAVRLLQIPYPMLLANLPDLCHACRKPVLNPEIRGTSRFRFHPECLPPGVSKDTT